MIWPLIAASAGAVGLNYQAAKDLDGAPGKRISPFWTTFALGAVTGLWIGVSFSTNICSAFSFLETVFGNQKPTEEETVSDTESEDLKTRKKRKQKN